MKMRTSAISFRPAPRTKAAAPTRSTTWPDPQFEHAAEANADRLAGAGQATAGYETTTPTGGRPLDPATRQQMGRQLGTDLSRVRLHADGRANALADGMGAEAITIGNQIYFGAGQLRPGSRGGDRLLAHELTHVAQQARHGLAVQPKLKIAGTPANRARALALLNSAMSLHSVSSSSAGEITIASTGAGPALQTEQALTDRLTTIIQDSHEVLMSVSAGTKTLGGSYATGDFDIADLEVYGVGGLIHEIEEQYQKQKNGTAFGGESSGAHAKAIESESAVTGGQRGAQRVISTTTNSDGTIDAVIQIPFVFPGNVTKTMEMTVVRNNITARVWK